MAIDQAFSQTYNTSHSPHFNTPESLRSEQKVHMHKPKNIKELKVFCMSKLNNIPLQMSPVFLEFFGRYSECYHSPQGKQDNVFMVKVPIIMNPLFCNK